VKRAESFQLVVGPLMTAEGRRNHFFDFFSVSFFPVWLVGLVFI
jgi:hypothetical protein